MLRSKELMESKELFKILTLKIQVGRGGLGTDEGLRALTVKPQRGFLGWQKHPIVDCGHGYTIVYFIKMCQTVLLKSMYYMNTSVKL